VKKKIPTSTPQTETWDFVNGLGSIGLCTLDYTQNGETWFVGKSGRVPRLFDILLVLMKSGKVGRFKIEGTRIHSTPKLWKARAWFLGYEEGYEITNPRILDIRKRVLRPDLLPVRRSRGMSVPLVRAVYRVDALACGKPTNLILESAPKLVYQLPQLTRSVVSQVSDLQDGTFMPVDEQWKVRARFDSTNRHSNRIG
jgi:hypothetical protein